MANFSLTSARWRYAFRRSRCASVNAPEPARVTGFGMVALALSIAVIFYLGILPTPVLDFAGKSIATIF